MNARLTGKLFIMTLVMLLIAPLAAAQEGESRSGFRPDAPLYGIRGPHPVGVMELVIADEARPLVGHIWYPALNPEGTPEVAVYNLRADDSLPPLLNTQDGQAILDAPFAGETGPYPLVVSSHGNGGSYFYTAYLHEHLASHGFVVMAFLHPGSSILDSMAVQSDEQQAAYVEGVIDNLVLRPSDIGRAIDYAETLTAPEGAMAGLIDTDRIGVIGLSYGGYSALAAAGARLDLDSVPALCAEGTYASFITTQLCMRHGNALPEREAALMTLAGVDAEPGQMWPSLGDPRIDAAASIVPLGVVFGDEGPAEVSIPTMILGASGDTMAVFQYNAFSAFEHLGADQKAFVVFENADHFFAGYCPDALAPMMWASCSDSVWDTARARDLTDHFITAFLLDILKDDTEAAAALAPEAVAFPGITYTAQGF